jgi:hypothetical protein
VEFDKAVRAARDEAIRRLSRELDDALADHARRGLAMLSQSPAASHSRGDES